MGVPWNGVNNPGIDFEQLTSSEVLVVQQIAALGDPNADRILFYDDSAGQFTYLTVGTGLSITNTTLAATAATLDGSGTTNEIAYWVDSDTLGALAVATYPSLTELSYVKGVTSALQTQLGAKASTDLSNLASVAINTTLVSDTDATDDLGTSTVKWNNIFGVNLGATGTRFTTGWFTDLTVTNAIAGSVTGNAGTITVADEATDATSFIGFYTAASGSLAGKTNANMTFNASTGVATFASVVLTTADINGGTLDGVTIGGSSAAAGTFTTVSGTTITASTGFALGDGDYIGVTGNEILTFNTAGTIVASGADFHIADGNGFVLGHSAQLATGGVTAESEQFGTAAADATQVIGMFNATAGTQAEFQFYRSKNASIGSATVVASGDGLGKITWYGAQQTGTFATQTNAAQIRAEVDGTVTSGAGGDMPGRIIFSTTADGSGTLTDRLILDSAGVLKPNANDGVALGTTALGFADLHLATGGLINFANGDAVITHSTGILTVSTGDLRVTTAGTNTASAVTVGGTQTLTNKGLTSANVNTDIAPTSNDGASLGTTTEGFSDLYLASGGNILVANANAKRTIVLTAAGGFPSTTAGCATNTKVETATNDLNYYTLDFDDTTQEHAEWTVIMPDSYDGGTVTAEFFWTSAAGSAGETVRWGIQARAFGNDDALDQAFGTAQEVSDDWIADGDVHITAATSAITIGGTPAGGKMVQFKVYRDTGDAADDHTGDAKLMLVKIEYGINAYSD